MTYTFSLITPNFNNEKYIKQAIRSAQQQAYPHWEMVIVDDASTDRSVEIIEKLMKTDNRIKLYRHEKNLGVAQAKHDAIVHSSGDIIVCLDGDDRLARRALAIMNRAYNKYPEEFIYANFLRCTEKWLIPYKPGFSKKIPDGKTALETDRVFHLVTFKRDKYFETAPLDPFVKRAVDKDLIYKLEEVCRLRFVPRFLYHYRVRKNSISRGHGYLDAKKWHEIVKENARKRRGVKS